MTTESLVAGGLQHAELRWARTRSLQKRNAGLRDAHDTGGGSFGPTWCFSLLKDGPWKQARQILNLSSMAPNKEAVREAHRRQGALQ